MNIANVFSKITSSWDARAERARAEAAFNAAEEAYRKKQSTQNWSTLVECKEAIEKIDTLMRGKAVDEDKERTRREEGVRARKHDELDEQIAIADGLADACAENVRRAEAIEEMWLANDAAMMKKLEKQIAASHRARALALELGVEVRVPGPASRGTIARLLKDALHLKAKVEDRQQGLKRFWE